MSALNITLELYVAQTLDSLKVYSVLSHEKVSSSKLFLILFSFSVETKGNYLFPKCLTRQKKKKKTLLYIFHWHRRIYAATFY